MYLRLVLFTRYTIFNTLARPPNVTRCLEQLGAGENTRLHMEMHVLRNDIHNTFFVFITRLFSTLWNTPFTCVGLLDFRW